MTLQAQQMIERLLYGPKPLTTFELIMRPGFINLILLIWSPIIFIFLTMYVVRKAKEHDTLIKEEIENKKEHLAQRINDAV